MDADKLVENKLLTIAGRVAIIVATACLPIAGTMLWRVLDKADAITSKVNDTALKVQLLDQSVTFGFEGVKGDMVSVRAQLGDHESRMRVMEHLGPPR